MSYITEKEIIRRRKVREILSKTSDDLLIEMDKSKDFSNIQSQINLETEKRGLK